MLFISPSNIEKTVISTYSNVYYLSEAVFFILALLSTLTRLKLPATGDSLSAVSPPFKWLTPMSHLVTTSKYSVSHLIVAWALINTPQTSAQYPTFTYGLSVISGLSLILRVASPLPVPLSVRGFNYANSCIRRLLLQYSLTKESLKLPCPCCQTHPLCYYVVLATCLPSLAAYPSEESLSSLPA